MGSQQTMRPQTGMISVPPNYPTFPSPGKLQMLLENNKHSIYHRYSPYFEYDSGLVDKLLGFGAKQPFIYDYIDEARKGLSGLRRYEGRIFPLGSAPRDVIRVTKYLASGQGVVFLGKQFILQANQAFNETQIYNPISPIIAAGVGLTLGQIRPTRHLDIYGGLGGIARSLIGNLGSAIFGDSSNTPPPGTAGAKALPVTRPDGGKGLLRGKTSEAGLAQFNKVWSGTESKFSWKSFGKALISSLIPNTFPKKQPAGTQFRADEGSYGIMLISTQLSTNQMWMGGTGKGNGIRKKGTTQVPTGRSRLFVNPDGSSHAIKGMSTIGPTLPQQTDGATGYEVSDTTVERKSGIRYGDSVGADIANAGPFQSSDIMVQYGMYVDEKNKYPSKKTEPTAVQKTKDELARVIQSIRKGGVYDIDVPQDNRVFPSVFTSKDGYDRLYSTTKGQPGLSPMNYPLGMLAAYRDVNVRMVDNSITTDPVKKSLKLPGAGNFDAINTLRIIPGVHSDNPRYIQFSQIPGWNKWEPYKDDQIAFFFYDAVNDKYIPFRATVKGINESAQASWEELSFIGRADRLYSYGGFTRSLNFRFDILISSIVELGPTWKRINYLMTLVKPARYTKSKLSGINNKNLPYNRFMVPPMVKITIGDLYKEQPIILNTVSIEIPEDAIWETMNEDNTDKGQWSYLVDYLTSKKILSDGKQYGQFPRSATITIACALLEKERAIVGAANFGHAPHTDKYHPMDISNQPYMHQGLVEYQFDHAVPAPTSPIDTSQYSNPVPIDPDATTGEGFMTDLQVQYLLDHPTPDLNVSPYDNPDPSYQPTEYNNPGGEFIPRR
jgi:hypothetical protein